MRLYGDDQARVDQRVEYRTPDLLDGLPNLPSPRSATWASSRHRPARCLYPLPSTSRPTRWSRYGAYLESGRPVIGLRTSTHAFAFPAESPRAQLNNGFGRDVLGSPWVSHHGHESTTQSTTGRRRPTPDPRGRRCPDTFATPSWLYRVDLAPDCEALLWGSDPVEQR